MNSLLQFEWRRFFKRLYDKALDTDIFNRSAQVAFYFSFALFPFLFFLVSVLGIVLESAGGLRDELFVYIRQILPSEAAELVQHTVGEIVKTSSGGKLAIGLVITLWSASSGIDGIRNALNAVYELKETRSWWATKAASLVFTLVSLALTAAVLGLVFYGGKFGGFMLTSIGVSEVSPFLAVCIQWISVVAVMLFACEMIYNLLPDFRRFKWIWITPGSVVAIVLWLILTSGFRAYVAYFNSYDKAYGSLGAVIILMLWLYLTALVVMIGGGINAVTAEMRTPGEEPAEGPEPEEG
jgi:membrane protein